MNALNKLNFHFGLHLYAFAIAEIFGAVYFYKLGIPIPTIFFYWTLFFFGRLLVRPLLLQLCTHTSSKTLYFIGCIFYAARYPLYAQLDGLSTWLLTLLIIEIIASTLYWTLYHAFFAHMGTLQRRGKEVAMRDSIGHIVNFTAPISTGFIIQYYGFNSAFYIATIFTLLGLLPILSLPSLPLTEKISFRDVLRRSDYTGFWYYIASAIHVYSHIFTWRLVVYIAFGDYIIFGSLMSLAVLFQIVGAFFVGHFFDKGKGYKFLTAAILLLGVTIVSRASLPLTISFVVATEITYMLGNIIVTSVINATTYNASKRSPSTIEFQFLAESGWDIGAIISTGAAGILTLSGIHVKYTMAVGLIGIIAFWLVGQVYREVHPKQP